MGVPALFRWLSAKYPKIVSPVQEEQPTEINGELIPVDLTKPNPNGVEFDNLYLDMNGIVHPCTHPEDRPPPATEDEAMILIFEYIDRIIGMIRPRKVLYMAIDGVAPRAKMNQQRSRRFRAAQEAIQKEEDEDKVRSDLQASGIDVPDKPKSARFDSNCITPGTPFMFRLSECLQYYVTDRLNNDPGWRDLKIILSDGSVPGEGEHKLMDFIRKQRLHPKYDPNTTHVIYGLDADLIMLALATHEPHFWVLREDVFANDGKSTKCFICNQVGHLSSQCTGSNIVTGEDKPTKTPKKPFVFLNVSILREYLDYEMKVHNLPFAYDCERVFDDWVFLCFFVGNDFLPHLPSLEIREGAIDTLIEIYKRNIAKQNTYLTDNGNVNLEFAQKIMEDLGEQEDEIFRKRREAEERRNENAARRKREREDEASVEAGTIGIPLDRIKDMSNLAVSVRDSQKFQSTNKAFSSAGKDMRTQNMAAAAALKAALGGEADNEPNVAEQSEEAKDTVDEELQLEEHESKKIRTSDLEDEDAEDPVVFVEDPTEEPVKLTPKIIASNTKTGDTQEEPYDEVRLWEPGWRERYYESKFGTESKDPQFRKKLVHAYVEGLCWVLRYYYQGCASWHWFYPYHYSPFASDFVETDLEDELKIKFSQGKPFKPFEQLMGVLPAASRSHIPEAFHQLMTDEESDIIDFYPEKFMIDLNGKKYAWQGVALLPFIDEKRLIKAMATKYKDLDETTLLRNIEGRALLFLSSANKLFDFLCEIYAMDLNGKPAEIDVNLSGKLSGLVLPWENACMPGSTFHSPLSDQGLRDIENNRSIVVVFIDPLPPTPDFEFPARLLPGVKLPNKFLSYQDFIDSQNQAKGKRNRNSGTGNRSDQRYDHNNNYNNQRDYAHGNRDSRRQSGDRFSPPRGGQRYDRDGRERRERNYDDRSYGRSFEDRDYGSSRYDGSRRQPHQNNYPPHHGQQPQQQSVQYYGATVNTASQYHIQQQQQPQYHQTQAYVGQYYSASSSGYYQQPQSQYPSGFAYYGQVQQPQTYGQPFYSHQQQQYPQTSNPTATQPAPQQQQPYSHRHAQPQQAPKPFVPPNYAINNSTSYYGRNNQGNKK